MSSQDPNGSGSGLRVPPHELKAELAVLSAILVQNDAYYRASDAGLEARDFYRESHQRIYTVIQELAERSEPIDLVTLTAGLKGKGWFEAVGGSAALTSLFEDSFFAASNVGHYAKIVRDKALLRRVIDTSAEIAGEAFDGVDNVEAFLDEAEKKMFSVSDSKASKGFSPMREVLVENMTMIEELAQKKQSVTGMETGFERYDRLTAGLQPGQLIIIAGRPAMGKTSLVLSIAQHAAVAKGGVVAVFSLEMSKAELGFRFLSGLARIDSKRLKVGRLADRDWAKLAQAAGQLSEARVHIDDSGDLSVMDMRARCRRLHAMEKKIDLIIVDYLQLMKGSKATQKGDGSREREISEISRNLKALAKELKVPIIALSQLNRGVESRQDKRPMLSDLRESGAIEQDADMVCFVYRDEVYNPNTEDKGVAELIVAKHRAGETATVRLAWLAEYTLFANLAEDPVGAQLSPGRPDRGDITL